MNTLPRPLRDGAPRERLQALGALLRNRDVLFCLALVLGVVAPGGARPLLPLALPVLGLVMTLAIMGLPLDAARRGVGLARPALAGIVLSYGLLSGLFLIAGRLVPAGSYLEKGFLALAMAPPAVAVIPFTGFFGGDPVFSLVGTVSAHLAGLVLVPVFAYAMGGNQGVAPTAVLTVLSELVLIPLALGAVGGRTRWAKRIAPWRGGLTNWGFFLVIYATTGANRDLLLGDPKAVAFCASMGIASTFGLALLIREVAQALRLEARETISAMLLGSLKNYGVAAGMALSFFGRKEAVPAVVCGAVMILYAVWFGRAGGPVKTGAGV